MILALDHTTTATVTPRIAGPIRAILVRVAAFHQYWFVECVEPRDPLASLSSRERCDLPVWHPTDPEH